MASSKKPTYKVETKLVVSERKRRKSDLVLIWQSFMDVTAIIVKELWNSVIRLWEFLQIWFSSSEHFLVQTWLEKYLPYVPDDFSESWRDGRLLAILLNKLQPGCFPDAYHLDPDYGLKNVYRVFDALEIYFGIKPNISAEEIVTCSDGSDLKLFAILLELKNLTDTQKEYKEIKPETVENVESSTVNQSCIVKGTGLAVGFVDRTSSFIIFCMTIADLDVVVEIKGPSSVCSERITKRSPRKRRSGFTFEYVRHLTRSASWNENYNDIEPQDVSNLEKRIIPLEYEIIGNQISLSYKPREKGEHKITILWHGQHVSDSPYIVTVEDPSDVVATKRVIPLKSAFKSASADMPEKHETRKISFQVQEPQNKCLKQERKVIYKDKPAGKVISRKLIRYIVKINGKDIPVNADSTQSLATELLKMDYDFETCPSFHRRNSWGFAGDAERKKSVIRQFGIDAKELDAQISHRRSRSLSMNPAGSKKLLERSDSFDSLTSKLNCLNEDIPENNGNSCENEDDYAYINEELNTSPEVNEVKIDSPNVMSPDNNADKNTNVATFLSELTGSKFDKNLEERSSDTAETDEISSLSMNKTQLEKVDRPKDDLQSNVSYNTPSHNCKLITVGTEDKVSTSYQFTDKNWLNSGSKRNDFIKIISIANKSKIFWNCSKVNLCQRKINIFFRKNSILKGKIGKFIVTISYRKISKNRNYVSSTPVVTYRKRKVKLRRILKPEKHIIPENCENIQINSMEESIKPNIESEEKILDINLEKNSSEHLNIVPQFRSKTKIYRKDNHIGRKLATNKKLKTKTDIMSFQGHIHQHLQTDEEYKLSKNIIEEIKATKVTLKCKSNPVLQSSVYSSNFNDDKAVSNHKYFPAITSTEHSILHRSCKDHLSSLTQPGTKPNSILSKPLHIHTLKTIEQFNFKQFNPSFDSRNSISPVKSQIKHWENTLSPEKECASPMKLHEASDTELVNIKEKLAFWECRSKESSSQNSSPENNRKINLKVNKISPDLMRNGDLQNHLCAESNSHLQVATSEESNKTFINEENRIAKDKKTDETTPEFQTNSSKIRSLSFSDPVVSETITDKAENTASIQSSELSGKDFSSSSSDDNLEEYDSSDNEDSGGDYLLHSTEDEYIDDEISERASEYWGDLSIVKNWKASNSSSNEPSSLDDEFLQNYNQRDISYPEECKVFGIAVYYGYVAVKNRFQVFTGNAGFGNLSVSMQGLRRHEVSLISVTYMRNDIYEVTYQVMVAGYYLISIRWMDRDIPGSPFVCKVTF